MCEILVFLANNTHADPTKDRRGCYKRGMPVVAYDDGHTWGRDESKQVWLNEVRFTGTCNTVGTQLIFTPNLLAGKLPVVPTDFRHINNVTIVTDGTNSRVITDVSVQFVNSVNELVFTLQTAFPTDLVNTVVSIKNEPNSWPNQGRLGILKIPGVLASKANEFIAHQTEDDTGIELVETPENAGVYRRRRWKFLIDSVPAGVRNTVLTTGEYSTTLSAIRTYLRRHRDNAQYTGFD